MLERLFASCLTQLTALSIITTIRHDPSAIRSHLGGKHCLQAIKLPTCPDPFARCRCHTRFKDREIKAMREKVPLPMLAAMVKKAPPVRDFKGALLAKQAAYGKQQRRQGHPWHRCRPAAQPGDSPIVMT